jgi:hypothetical protein
MAGVTCAGSIRRERLLSSPGSLLKGDRKLHFIVLPLLVRGFPPHAIPEQVSEDVTVAGENVFRGVEAAKSSIGLDLGLAPVIVGRPGLRIIQDIVGLGDLLEFRLRCLVAGMPIGMILSGQFSKRAADVLRLGVSGHSEFGIVVWIGHGLPGFQALELKPKDAVFVSGLQEFRRTGKSDVSDQDSPLDLPIQRRSPRGRPLGPDDDPAAFERDIDFGLDDPGKSDLEHEIVPFFQEIKDEIEKRFGHTSSRSVSPAESSQSTVRIQFSVPNGWGTRFSALG